MKKLHWYYKFLILFLIFFSMFFFLTKNMSKIVNSSPYKNFINYISVPFDFINKYNIFNYKNVLEENEELSKKMIIIENDKKEKENLEEEVKKLKELLELKKLYTEYNKIYAKTISRNKMYWYSTITIDKGSNDKITKDSLVVTSKGLIGTIQNVTKDYSTVKLITNSDTNNKLSVGIKTEQSFKHGTIVGYTYPYLKVELTTDKEGIDKSDKLVTSGLGSLPKNIEIGTVEKIEKDSYGVSNVLYVKPLEDMNDINYVLVLTK